VPGGELPPLYFSMGLSFRVGDFADAARLIEEVGFEAVSAGEHVAFHGPTPSAFINLAYVGGIAPNLRLLSAITLVPLYPVALLAKQAAMLDVVSNGRFDLGVGVGGEYPPEFEAVGVPHAERGARTDEALELLPRLWSGEKVTFDGRFTKLPGISIDPPPVRRPSIWVAGRKGVAMRRAGRFGDFWNPYMYTPEMLADSIVKVREAAVAAGREPDAVRSAINCFIHVDRDGAKARRVAAEAVGGVYKQDFSGHRFRYLVAGTPAECAERLGEHIEAGSSGAVFSLACGPDEAANVIRLTGEEVLPAVRERYGG
jgi:alkanesulfonate monooxygenase SsuD/methylene tetrahydromethanopterin reductase-like flavin-dependent oxidoreductase (luciferase family)